jgi:hypothetical protein
MRTETMKDAALQALRAAGFVSAVVRYSGGHDEGGADGITVTRGDGTTEELRETYHYPQRWDDEARVYVNVPDLRTAEEKATNTLYAALCQPVYDEWGSFAGEFYVNGSIEYDVAAGTAKRAQDVEVPSYESDEDYL